MKIKKIQIRRPEIAVGFRPLIVGYLLRPFLVLSGIRIRKICACNLYKPIATFWVVVLPKIKVVIAE